MNAVRTTQPSAGRVPRTDPARDTRRLVLYFGGTIAVYVIAVLAFWPKDDEDPSKAVFLAVMFAPTAGALLARFFGPGVIQWGRLSLWIFAGLAPVVVVLGAYLAGAALGLYTEDPSLLRSALIGAWFPILSASVSAFGEEVGWRGFLWPLMRRRSTFWRTSLAVLLVWWVYHLPMIAFGWYGSMSGLPAFTLAIAGFTLFVGVLTDRARAIWPSVVAHGAWNALIATSFAVTEGTKQVPAFAGSDALLGEFGWLAAVSMLALGLLAGWWHVSHPVKREEEVSA